MKQHLEIDFLTRTIKGQCKKKDLIAQFEQLKGMLPNGP